jgi:hypothetical protein
MLGGVIRRWMVDKMAEKIAVVAFGLFVGLGSLAVIAWVVMSGFDLLGSLT